jgi:hypothetical protein
MGKWANDVPDTDNPWAAKKASQHYVGFRSSHMSTARTTASAV